MAQTSLNSTGVASSGSLVLQSNGTTAAVTIDTSQNMGLGVTPSAWSSYKSFDLQGGSFASGTGTRIQMWCNGFYNGTNSVYRNTGAATLYDQSSGSHSWFNAASGTAGNAITFTQAMTLDASGNLGVGTTSPSYRLDVSGNIIRYSNGTYEGFMGSGSSLAGGGATDFNIRSEAALTFATGGGTERARIDSSGNLLMGRTDNPSSVSGCFYSVGTYNQTSGVSANVAINANGLFLRATSSLKYKNDVQDATHGLADVLKLRAVTYKSNRQEESELTFGGLIAEEVHAAGLTEFVQYAEDGTPDALAYGNMVSLCIKAIQEQQALITQLQADVAALKA